MHTHARTHTNKHTHTQMLTDPIPGSHSKNTHPPTHTHTHIHAMTVFDLFKRLAMEQPTLIFSSSIRLYFSALFIQKNVIIILYCASHNIRIPIRIPIRMPLTKIDNRLFHCSVMGYIMLPTLWTFLKQIQILYLFLF